MGRQVLRYPVGREFRKILDDDVEYCVITSTQLKPLIVKPGERGMVSRAVELNAYMELERRIPPGKIVPVYNLHTHPIGGHPVPSIGDMHSFFNEKRGKYVSEWHGRIRVVGHGVITKKGIIIVKISQDPEKRSKAEYRATAGYETDVDLDMKRKTGDYAAYRSMDDVSRNKLLTDVHKRAFRKVVSEEPAIKTRIIRRTHRYNMRVRR
jgi:hypothetical protein